MDYSSPVRGRLKGTTQTVILHRPQLPVGYLDKPQAKPLMSGIYLDKPQCSKAHGFLQLKVLQKSSKFASFT